MIPLYVICALAAAGFLCFEALVLSGPRRLPYPRWFPGLLVGIAGLGLIFSILMFRAWLVISPEFGLAMIEGGAWAYLGILTLILLYALSLGLLVSVIRNVFSRPNRAVWSVRASIVVVVLAYAGIQPLDPGESSAVQVLAYDLWWPPFILWLSACLVEASLTVARVENRMRRVCVHAFVASAVGLIAMQRPDFLNPSTQLLWQYVALIVFCLSAGLAPLLVWWTLRRPGGTARPTSRTMIVTLASCAVIAVTWLVWPEYQEQAAWIVWGVAAIAVAAAIGWQVRISRRERATTVVSIPGGQRVLMAAAVLTIAVSLLDLFYFDLVDTSLALVGNAAGWATLAEATGGGFLSRCYRLLTDISRSPDDSPGRAVLHWGFTNLRNALAGMLRLLGRVFAASSLAGVLLKVAIGIVLLVALSEVPNAGTTIIGSFTAESSDGKDAGLADHLVNALHTLNEGLRSDLSDVALVSSQAGSRTSKSDRSFRFAAADGGTANLGAALAKQQDVPMFGVTIPVGLLVAPIQAPARWLLGVRVISGSVHKEPHNTTALARSSRGDSWSAQVGPSRQAKCTVIPNARPPAPPIATANGPSPAAGPSTIVSDIPDAHPDLAEQLALQITTADESSPAWLTRSPLALASFQCGWSAWRKFETETDLTQLAEAVKHFGEATRRDWGFSLAHYWLGRALREAHQPGAATEAFRASVAGDPEFGAGLASLAFTLYDYDTFLLWPQPAVRWFTLAQTELTHLQTKEQKRAPLIQKNEAARIWRTMVHAPVGRVSSRDRASASAGLCTHALSDDTVSTFLTYFYCKRADRIYATMDNSNRADADLRAGASRVAYMLGLTLESRFPEMGPVRTLGWSCATNNGYQYGPYSRAALKYYDRAITLNPDDHYVRCQAALTAEALGDPTRLQALSEDFAARLSLAGQYLTGQHLRNENYETALTEYAMALERNPNSVDALNGYAYTFWASQYALSQKDPSPGESPAPSASDKEKETAKHALDYANRAVALVDGKRPKDIEIMIQGTLGEVMLGRKEYQAAREQLEKAYNSNSVKDHAEYNELRWDLAQALRCLARNGDDSTGKSKPQAQAEAEAEELEKQANALLREIETLERDQDLRSFSRLGLFDDKNSFCRASLDQASPPLAAASQ